jgi:dipeptidyl aminopeptidase/acylaminoacyl peptidase
VIRRKTTACLLFLILAVTACRPFRSGVAAPAITPTPLKAPTPTAFAPQAVEQSPTPEPDAGEPPAAEADGWLFFSTWRDGVVIDTLWLADASGEAAWPLAEELQAAVPWDWDLSAALAPDRRSVALVTTTNPPTLSGLTLVVLSLPEGDTLLRLPLTTPELDVPADTEFPWDDERFQMARTLTEVASVAWSPDGQRLAFMGAIEGQTSDLYTYSFIGPGGVTRLTDGPSQGIRPIWSPDGQYVVHAGVSGMGTGAGYGMEGVWAAAADGSEVITLYRPGTGDEQWLGWVDDRTLLVYSWSALCGYTNLRTVDILSGESVTLWPGFFAEIAYDPGSLAYLLTFDQYTAACQEDGAAPGAYIGWLTPGEGWQVAAGDVYRPVYSPEAGAFFVWSAGEGALKVGLDGAVEALPAPIDDIPVAAPGGAWWAWASNLPDQAGVWVGPVGSPPDRIFDEPAYYATWHPGGDRLAFFSEGTLYLAAAPDFAPQRVAGGLSVANWAPVWIMP